MRLIFPSGVEMIHKKGMITGKGEAVYLVRGRKGRRLVAQLHLPANQYAALQVRSPNGTLLVSEDGTDAGLEWRGVLESTGEYRIIVFGPETAGPKERARFLLEVSLK